MRRRWFDALIWVALPLVLSRAGAYAGPPFITDDPEPVDHLHWEFYMASTQRFHDSNIEATLPHFELNYGVMPDVQLHLLVPFNYVRTTMGTGYGYSNTEFGVKIRFLGETDDRPQIGTFPIVEIPTEIWKDRLEDSNLQILIPVWIQKSWGNLTSYGGAGYWYNQGQETRNWAFVGWVSQYTFSDALTLGGELNYHTPDTVDGESEVMFQIGGYLNMNENHHLLFSFGPTVTGEKSFSGYLGYQLTL